MDIVKLLIDMLILWVELELRLEIVSVLLLLLSKLPEEVGVVLGPPLPLLIEHSLLPPFVVHWVSKCSSIEFLHFIENPIEFHDGLFNFVPSFIHVTAEWDFSLVSHALHLVVNETVGFLESINLLMSLLKFLELVSWINHNSISLVIVYMDVHIGAWYGLHLGLRSISEIGSQVDSQILFSHLEVGDGSKHGTIVVIELRSLILQSNELKALSADMAPVKWSLSNKVEHLLMGMRIILNGWTHTDDNSPG